VGLTRFGRQLVYAAVVAVTGVFRDRADRLGDKATMRSLDIAESTFYRHVAPRTKPSR